MASARPAYGRRLMPSVLDELARTTPYRLYAAIPKSADVTDGFRDISVADIARCADFMAHWIEGRFGRSDSFETISFIGIPDLRGAVVFQAAVKTGYKLLLPSPRNPPSTNVSLMNQTGSTKLLYASEVAPIVGKLKELDAQIHLEQVPTFEEMMSSEPKNYPFEKDFDQSRNEPVVVLHSSGSTGLPKPITMTHGSFAVLDNEHNLPDVPGRRKRDWSMWTFDGEARVYTVFPFFHLAGFLMMTLQTIFMNASPVLGPPNMIPDGSLLKAVMERQKLRSIFLPPAVIEQLLQEPDGINFFKDLDFLVYSGAPFNPVTGDMLTKVVELISPFGATECYPQPELAPSREDWQWHEFNPYIKHEMQVYDADEGTFELVILMDETTKDTAASYHNLPGLSEYRTKDLFTQHPEKLALYKYYGRRDDIIVLANGEKFNPIPAEVHMGTSPALKGAFIVGNTRTQPVLLVEPKEPLAEGTARAKLLDDLRPKIEEANGLIAGQGRIHHGKVLCAVPSKPFTRTGKGTIVRKLTEAAYKDEIDALYNAESPLTATTTTIRLKATYDMATVTQFVSTVIATAFPPAAKISGSDDLFSHGLDSVQTLEIVSSLKRSLRVITPKSLDWLKARVVFQHNTIDRLTKLIHQFVNADDDDGAGAEQDSKRVVDDTVSTYTKLLPAAGASPTVADKSPSIVAVMGSTGYLGAYLVATLLRQPGIERIYCLNRGADGKKRTESALLDLDAGLAPQLTKLSYMTMSIGKPQLGLDDTSYATLVDQVQVIIYNSWRLDFGLAIDSFAPFLQTTVDLAKLSSSSKQRPRILFISSLSSVMNLAVPGPAPESLVQDAAAPTNTGYAQSKHAAERILGAAASGSGIPVTIVRVGQIGGTSLGSNTKSSKWADQPWLSAIAHSAKALGSLPARVAAVDWVPVDIVADMLRDFALLPQSAGPSLQVYHINHPTPLPWQVLIDVIRSQGGADMAKIPTIPLREWTKQLRTKFPDPSAEDAKRVPAIKMLDFYEGLGDEGESAKYETKEALRVSKAGAAMQGLDGELLGEWVRAWSL